MESLVNLLYLVSVVRDESSASIDHACYLNEATKRQCHTKKNRAQACTSLVSHRISKLFQISKNNKHTHARSATKKYSIPGTPKRMKVMWRLCYTVTLHEKYEALDAVDKGNMRCSVKWRHTSFEVRNKRFHIEDLLDN